MNNVTKQSGKNDIQRSRFIRNDSRIEIQPYFGRPPEFITHKKFIHRIVKCGRIVTSIVQRVNIIAKANNKPNRRKQKYSLAPNVNIKKRQMEKESRKSSYLQFYSRRYSINFMAATPSLRLLNMDKQTNGIKIKKRKKIF